MPRWREWLTDSFSPTGWAGVPDDEPLWTATVEARWTPPQIDWGQFLAGLALTLVFVAIAVHVWLNGPAPIILFPIAGATVFGWPTLQQLRARGPATEMTLVLGPDALRLSAAVPNLLSVEMRRHRAGWLVAEELSTNWHWRELSLYEEPDRGVAAVVGSLATVRMVEPGIPPASRLPDQVPVAVLLGTWWPHPARRMTRGGSMNVRFRWRDPDLADFPRHERRQRLLWTLLYGALALMFLAVAILEERPLWFRLAFAGAGLGLVVWRVHVLRWQPRFLGRGQPGEGAAPSAD